MTPFPLTSWFLTGGLIGVANGAALWWTVAHLRPEAPRRAVLNAVGGSLLRWALVSGLLVLALRQGIWPCLVAFAGLWMARWAVASWFGFSQAPFKRPGAWNRGSEI